MLKFAPLNRVLEPDWPMVSRDIGGGLRSHLEATGSVRHPLHDALQASGSSHVRHRSKQHDMVHRAVHRLSG